MSRREQLSRLATQLAEAWQTSSVLTDLPDSELPVDREESYFVQDAMSETLGEALTGWKVGATSARMRELDGHDDVIPGRIFRSVTWQGERHTLPIARFPAARVETEFAFRLLTDLPIRNQAWSAQELDALVVFVPAVEIIGNRHDISGHPAPARSLMTIADNGGGIGFVFGQPVNDWREVDFQQHHISLRINDGSDAENFLGEMRCQPLEAVADLVAHLASRGYWLREGDFVSTGAATVPQAIEQGAHVLADFGALGTITIDFE